VIFIAGAFLSVFTPATYWHSIKYVYSKWSTMIEQGARAPSFVLPAVEDGEVTELDLDSVFGSDVVILAFYPGDFNPACSGAETGLDELDLFTMQKDVRVLAISADSVHSHQAFAEEYNLHLPLLSDTDGEMARAYGVAVDDDTAGYLTNRAVAVVDHTGTVQYTWESERPTHVPTADEIRRAVEGIGDDETAESRYRVGHAHYMEGRRAFTSAMKAYDGQEWMMAQTDFTQACEEFGAAGDEFNTATRFAESGETRTYFERAEEKSEALWRAADWLADSASAFASGEGARAESLRRDAEAPLETARDLHEPPGPDNFPPDEAPAELDDEPVHPLADDEPAATLDADIDAEIDPAADGEEQASTPETDVSESADQPVADAEATAETGDEQATEIDDEELEEITAELEEQTEAVQEEADDTDESDIERGDEASPDVELELSDPTDEDDDDDETLSEDTGDHGVPDSL
jgi:peroxiredoxin